MLLPYRTDACLSVLTASLLLASSCIQPAQLAAIEQSPSIEEPAEVVILRPGIMGSALRVKTYYDHELVGWTGARSYLAWEIEPGVHTIGSSTENYDTIRFTALPGQSYYFRQSLSIGFIEGRVNLSRMEMIKAESKISKLKAAKLIPQVKASSHRKAKRALSEAQR